jgi:hypothetical protein
VFGLYGIYKLINPSFACYYGLVNSSAELEIRYCGKNRVIGILMVQIPKREKYVKEI